MKRKDLLSSTAPYEGEKRKNRIADVFPLKAAFPKKKEKAKRQQAKRRQTGFASYGEKKLQNQGKEWRSQNCHQDDNRVPLKRGTGKRSGAENNHTSVRFQ